jgi:proline iminopeptidase
MKHERSFSHLGQININDSRQWVLVRGKNIEAPLLIHVQAGPGLPMIPEADQLEKKLHLENNFLVAYWDQRGTGKSFAKSTITLSQMAEDILSCTRHLLKKYNKDKAILVGYSIGATLSLMAAAKDPGIFRALFLAGTDVDIPYANKYMLDFAMDNAVAANNKKLTQKIDRLIGQPIIEAKLFRRRAMILTDLGGIRVGHSYNSLLLGTVKNILFSKFYGIGGLIKTIKGMEFCQNSLLQELDSLDLFSKVTNVQVPVHFLQGKLDAVAPLSRGREYYDQLQAVEKTFTVFELSAHMPHYEESEKFSATILSVLGKQH